MPLATFYQTVAQLCFTLLGLWWLVLQTKYQEWTADAARRRMLTNISLYFLLPGSMSLMALLAGQQHLLWQVSFFIASAIGAVETSTIIRHERELLGRRAHWTRSALLWAGAGLYAVVALAALAAIIPGAAGRLHIDPLTTAGVLITLLVVAGVLLAWLYFIEPAAVALDHEAARHAEQRTR
jgi:hypothetical protein